MANSIYSTRVGGIRRKGQSSVKLAGGWNANGRVYPKGLAEKLARKFAADLMMKRMKRIRLRHPKKSTYISRTLPSK
jgi:hypothetical protein